MDTTNETPNRIKIDASLLTKSNCELRYYLLSQGWRTDKTNYKAAYGTAGHKALQKYYSNFNSIRDLSDEERKAYILDCIKLATEFFTPFQQEGDMVYNNNHLTITLLNYFKHYKDDHTITTLDTIDNSPLTESKFILPDYRGVDLCGTIDLPCEYYGRLSIMDHKFTGTSNPSTFMTKFLRDVQPMFYVWIYKKLVPELGYLPFVINAIYLKKPTSKSSVTAEFERSKLIEFSEERMEKFEIWVHNRIEMLKNFYSGYHQPYPEFSACNQGYPLCQFSNACNHNSMDFENALKMEFIKREYNPLEWQD